MATFKHGQLRWWLMSKAWHAGLLSLKTLVCKLVGVTCSMAGGLIAGKEGPFIHTGGIVGGGFAAMGSLTLTELFKGRYSFVAPRKYGGFFRKESEHRDFISIGTAAGVATAFAAPIGGLLLAIEEGSSFLSLGLFWRGFLATCTGVLTLHVAAQCHGNAAGVLQRKFGLWRDLGLYDDNLALYGKRYYYYVWELPIYAVMGAIAGLLGSLFIYLNIRATALRARYIPPRKPKLRLLEVLGIAWLIASIFFLICYSCPCAKLPPRAQLQFFEQGGDDQDIFAGVDDMDSRGLKYFPRMWCGRDEFNPRAQLFFTPLVQAMRLMIHLGETVPEGADELAYHISAGTLVLWTFVVFILMLCTFGIGAASGIFIPSLTVGGAWGRLIGMLVQACLVSSGSSLRVSLPAYTVVGAAAMLGGVTRMTISITVLVMEGSGALQLTGPLMVAVFVAKMVGDALTPSIYDVHIKIRGAPVLMEDGQETRQRMANDKLSVSELATTALVALPPVVPLTELAETLRACRFQTFPISPDVNAALCSDVPFDLHGVVMRSQLLRMLKHRIGFCQLSANAPVPSSSSLIPTTQAERLDLLSSLQQLPLKVRTEEQEAILQGMSRAEMGMALDLRRFMQRTPFVLQGNASLARAYRLFRTMGLHHLYVGPPKPQVIGLLTRKDVTEENAEVFLGAKANKGLVPARATVPRLRHSRSSLPNIPYYEGQAEMLGYSDALALEPVQEEGIV
ncbi:g660 [Coccomyxa viridis]|uniref:Chloride channel protein n=1 Tax=Coccomyxa viridis TaxID=1274662 RepID=A0ABP1FK85_9CHLO